MSSVGEARAVLLYDGDCGLCARSVLFVFHRDPHARVHFASLQSLAGKSLLRQHGVPLDMTTMVLIDAHGAHVGSTAVLRTALLLSWPWPCVYALRIVPRALRDAAYRFIAKHRNRIGPAVQACANPTSELRARMRDG